MGRSCMSAIVDVLYFSNLGEQLLQVKNEEIENSLKCHLDLESDFNEIPRWDDTVRGGNREETRLTWFV